MLSQEWKHRSVILGEDLMTAQHSENTLLNIVSKLEGERGTVKPRMRLSDWESGWSELDKEAVCQCLSVGDRILTKVMTKTDGWPQPMRNIHQIYIFTTYQVADERMGSSELEGQMQMNVNDLVTWCLPLFLCGWLCSADHWSSGRSHDVWPGLTDYQARLCFR